MKALFNGHLARKFGVLLAGMLALVLMQNVAMASISQTRHNLGSTNVGAGGGLDSANSYSGTAEICIFCHTPHGSDASAAVPLWNRTLSSPGIYTRYSTLGTATFDAAEAPIGSVSIACLSCHDGTQSLNVVINAPGSGSVAMTGTWTGAHINANGTLAQNGTYNFPLLGTDLRDDHPISMQYGGGGISDTTPIGTTTDTDFAQAVASTTPTYRSSPTAAIGQVGQRTLGSGRRVWWVETNNTAGQQKDDLTLYSRTDLTSTGLGVNQPFVECATCHDPHSTNTTFLRRAGGNSGSITCLTCHDK